MKTTPATVTPTGSKRGPRGPEVNTRELILAAAQEVFDEEGYSGATMRAVASRAGVDVSLISYYFDCKDELFLQAMDLPANPKEVLALAVEVDLENLGESLARAVLGLWEASYQTAIQGVLESMLVRQSPWRAVREYWATHIVAALAEHLDAEDATYRAALASAALASVAFARHVVGLEPIVEQDLEKLVADIAPTIQHYLTGDLN
jgi:AcrR family transcriptional regulator